MLEKLKTHTSTPPKITDAIRKFCKELNAKNEPFYVPVKPEPDSQTKECFFNVKKR